MIVTISLTLPSLPAQKLRGRRSEVDSKATEMWSHFKTAERKTYACTESPISHRSTHQHTWNKWVTGHQKQEVSNTVVLWSYSTPRLKTTGNFRPEMLKKKKSPLPQMIKAKKSAKSSHQGHQSVVRIHRTGLSCPRHEALGSMQGHGSSPCL